MRLLLKLLAFLALCAVALLAAVFIGPDGGFFPIAVLAAFLLCSAVCTGIGALRLSCGVWMQRQIFLRGETTESTLHLHNRSPFPLVCVAVTACVLQPGGKTQRVSQVLTFAPGQSRRVPLPVSLAHVGPSRVALERLSVQDFSGLFRFPVRKKQAALDALTVPRLDAAALASSFRWRDGESLAHAAKIGRESDLFDGTRPYANGDPLHGIHWKLTAHTGHLMSRTHERSLQRSFAVAVDLFTQGTTPAEFDRLTEEPLGLAQRALESGLDTAIFYADKEGTHICRPTSKADLETLGKKWAGGSGPAAAGWLDAALSGGGRLFLCTAKLTDGLVHTLLRQTGAEPCLLWITDASPEDAARQLMPLTRAGIACRTLPLMEKHSSAFAGGQP